MIIYIATWPRCGNALTRNLLWLNFRLITANGYPSTAPWPDKLRCDYFSDFVQYTDNDRPPRLALQHGALDRLNANPKLRRACAAMKQHFLVKTHERPPVDPLDGEAYISLTRHPVRAVASHTRMHADKPAGKMVRGFYQGGRYDEWHEAWQAAMPGVMFRYEDIIGKPQAFMRRAGELMGLTPPDIIKDMPMELSHKANPHRNPGLGLEGWKDYLSMEEAAYVWAEYGDAAKRFGYEPLHQDASSEPGKPLEKAAGQDPQRRG